MGIHPLDSHAIVVIEQENEDSIYKDWTWSVKFNEEGEFHCFGVTDLIKTDGIDRMYGAPNPNTTFSDPYGWWYMECIGDNNYQIAYQDTYNWKVYNMDIGYMDNDSLVDVVTMTHQGQKVFESKDMNMDTFVHVASPIGGGYYYSEIIGDIDKDGYNNYIAGGKIFDQSPAEWLHYVMECKGDNTYDTIWQHWIRKDYGPQGSIHSGCGGTSGDIDGDGEDELILCAGSIIEVFECVANDSFEMIWSMDNDTFAGSSVITYDFNGNGIDEIVWSGRSDEWLPYTYGIDMMKTYIIEWRRLWIEDSLELGNSESGDTLKDNVWIVNRGDTTLNIDSMVITNNRYMFDTTLTYPVTLNPDDSMNVKIKFYSESIGVYTGELYTYGDKSRYKTNMIAGSGIVCLIDSIVASDGGVAQTGIDEDDYVTIYFDRYTNQPSITKDNIESVLRLGSGDTWGEIESAGWLFRMNGKDRLRVNLSVASGTPEISVADTIYPDSLTITELLMNIPCHDETVIRGSFGPAGINTPKEGTGLYLSFHGFTMGNSILEYTTYTKDTRVEIYDITGRTVFTNGISNIGLNTVYMKPLASGIYFIRIKTPKESISKSIIRM